jgi:hypothetical protein
MMATHDDDFIQALEDVAREGKPKFEPGQARAFASALQALNEAGVPYMVGGAFAKHAYTGIWRDTKDLDLFLKPEDLKTALEVLTQVGFETEIEFQHWLAKARQEPYSVDLIFGTGHGQLQIDDGWLEHSQPTKIAGVNTRLIPIEELIVSKAYVAERYRFDGADIVHLIQGAKGRLDWQRVLTRLGDNRGLLLWHLILFDFVLPGHADDLPQALMTQLFEEVRQSWTRPQPSATFRGTLLDPFSFLVDIEDWGYEDQRDLAPLVDEGGEAV